MSKLSIICLKQIDIHGKVLTSKGNSKHVKHARKKIGPAFRFVTPLDQIY